MSAYSDENIANPTSDSFWELGNYKKTVKRIDEGHRLCNDLMAMIHERSEIEKSYAKQLRQWAKKWNDLLEKGPEYGTISSAWKAVLTESERNCDIHLDVKEKLMTDTHQKVKLWQKENYHKKMLSFKETVEADEGFKKAQKPWAKLLAKVTSTKKSYHNMCKLEKSAINGENNAKEDSSLSPDQNTSDDVNARNDKLIKKLRDKVEKCRQDKIKAKEKYEKALSDLTNYNARYMEDMTLQFNKTQDFEGKRLDFFKEILSDLHERLDLSSQPKFSQVYSDFIQTVSNADSDKDLKWWKNTYGTGMAMNWPAFEEYSEELHSISSRKKNKGNVGGGDEVMLTNASYKSNSAHSDPAITFPVVTDSGYNSSSQSRFSGYNEYLQTYNQQSPPEMTTSNQQVVEEKPYTEDPEWDEPVGVPVKALYDYEGAEEDELSFKKDDVFTKLEDEDEQGWCRGRIDGRDGLYPANYAEPI